MRRGIAVLVGLLAIISLKSATAQPDLNPSDEATARAHFAAGRFAKAEEYFSRALASDRPKPALLYNRALARFNRQNYSGAKQDLDAHLSLAPSTSAALALRAEVNLLLGNAAAALNDAENALESQPEDLELVFLRARARQKLGRADAARGDLERILERTPSHSGALVARGELFLAAGEWDAAEADFRRAAEISPNEADAPLKIGLTRFRRFDFAGATEALERAAQIAPAAPLVFRTLGCAYYGQGDFSRAAAALQRAIELEVGPAIYANLLLDLSKRRLGQKAAVPNFGPKTNDPSWSELLLQFHLQELSEDDLLLAARNLTPAAARSGRWCEAQFYVGSEHLIAGDYAAARHCFQEAIATQQAEFVEYTLAKAELARLPSSAPTAAPKRQRRR